MACLLYTSDAADDEEHFTHIKNSVEIISSWNLDADVVGVGGDENFVPHLVE